MSRSLTGKLSKKDVRWKNRHHQRGGRGASLTVANDDRPHPAGYRLGALRRLGRAHLSSLRRRTSQTAAYDHVDFRVRDLRAVTRFYDAVMRALGFTNISKSLRSREYYQRDRWLPFFALTQAAKSVPNLSRIAFAADSRKEVDRLASVARASGARSIEGPLVCRSYRQPYYAVFFEDPDGNKFEICCRR
jgi:catechol 2,3-dioxygenase-like lactoylglutathione lyase family enzyme